jgi:hypothetical protein
MLLFMFETEDFRTRLRDIISTEAARGGLERYETAAVDLLREFAIQNERELMETENRKMASERRGVEDALRSARELAQLASRYAAAERRTVLKSVDIEQARQERFCRVWPFCKS